MNIIIKEIELRYKWQPYGEPDFGGGHKNRFLVWTDYKIRFDQRDKPMRRGDCVVINGVDCIVTGYTGEDFIAEGRVWGNSTPSIFNKQ